MVVRADGRTRAVYANFPLRYIRIRCFCARQGLMERAPAGAERSSNQRPGNARYIPRALAVALRIADPPMQMRDTLLYDGICETHAVGPIGDAQPGEAAHVTIHVQAKVRLELPYRGLGFAAKNTVQAAGGVTQRVEGIL